MRCSIGAPFVSADTWQEFARGFGQQDLRADFGLEHDAVGVGGGDDADALCAFCVVVLLKGVEDAVGDLGAANDDDAAFALLDPVLNISTARMTDQDRGGLGR